MARIGWWAGFLLVGAGLLLGVLSLTSVPWLRVSNGADVYGVRFSVVNAGTHALGAPAATRIYFDWPAWLMLGALAIGAVLSALRIERAWVIASLTVVASIAAIALMIQACRPLVDEAHGIRAGPGPWFAATGYLLLGAGAVVRAIAGRASRM